jgi:hypothetical protein
MIPDPSTSRRRLSGLAGPLRGPLGDLLLGLLALISMTSSSKAPSDPAILAGHWTGALFGPGPAQVVEVDFDGEHRGTIGFVHDDAYRLPLGAVEHRGGKVRFQAGMPDRGVVRFEGKLKGGLISGRVKSGERDFAFHLLRIEDRPQSYFLDFAGWYRLPGGERAFVTVDPYGGLAWIDFEGFDSGYLLPAATDEFMQWEYRPEIDSRWRFARDPAGEVTGFTVVSEKHGHDDVWMEDGSRATRVEDAPSTQEQVRFPHGQIELAGLLLTPSGGGLHPAIVMMPGSGHQTRERSRELFIANRMLEEGFAVLLYDKRGSGLSGGDWHHASLVDLAGDALAGVRFLEDRPEVDGSRIGLYGLSQGGHLTPFAANRSDAVRFIVNDSGSVSSLAEAELHAVAWRARDAGLGEEDVSRAVELARLRFDSLMSERASVRYREALAAHRGEKWLDPEVLGPLELPPDDWRVWWWRSALPERAHQEWRELHVPSLTLFGGMDKLVAVETDAAFLRGLGRKVVVFPEAGHGIGQAGGPAGFAPGYLDTLAAWLRER